MRNNPLIRPIPSENHAISARTSTRIHLLVAQNMELVVWPHVWEAEALIVFILVRVSATAGCLANLIVAIALLDRGVDIGLGVAGRAAGFGALTLADVKDWGLEWYQERENERGGAKWSELAPRGQAREVSSSY